MADNTWNNGTEDPWQVPPYLQNTYVIWTLLGEALAAVSSAHVGGHLAETGFLHDDGEQRPPDTLMTALFSQPVDADELAKWHLDEEYVSLHDALSAAVASLQMAVVAVVAYVSELGALPPWWQEEFDALQNMPEMWEEEDG